MYAKLIDGRLEYAPNPITIDGQDIFTNDPTQCGYKLVINTEQPIEEGYYYTPYWIEDETQITQHWERHENTAEMNVSILKEQLSETDYKAIKYAEGWITEEEYAPIKAERQAIRNRINELEALEGDDSIDNIGSDN